LQNAKGKVEEIGGRDSMAHKGSAGTITKPSSLMNLQKAGKPMVSIVGARCFAPGRGHAQRAPTLQGAQKIIGGGLHELPQRVRRNDEVAAQSRSERDRWTFSETVKFQLEKFRPSGMIKKSRGFLVV
jgi:hypothetical protein